MQEKSYKPESELGEGQENFRHTAIHCCALLVKTRGLGRSNKKGHNSQSEKAWCGEKGEPLTRRGIWEGGQWMSKIQEKKNPIANNNTETPPIPSVNSISGPQYASGMGG